MGRYKTEVNEGIIAAMVRPSWNDTLRGILVALVKDRRQLWDARFRASKERAVQLFREIATILSNQDSRMNEWYVLEKWCWMMEMFARTTERPTFEWRFKGAMSFHLESSLNGIQYIDCLSPEILKEATARYAETEEEIVEAGRALCKKSRKGSGVYREEMNIFCKTPESGAVPFKVPATRSKTRSVLAAALGHYEGNSLEITKNGQSTEENEALSSGDIFVKEEPQERDSHSESAPSATVASSLKYLISNSSHADANGVVEDQFISQGCKWSAELVRELIKCFKDRPPLWYHPRLYMNHHKELLCEVADRLRNSCGGATMEEDALVEKWCELRDKFRDELSKLKQGGASTWEFFEDLHFLTPQFHSIGELDEEGKGGSTPVANAGYSDISMEVHTQLNKILGYVPDAYLRDVEPPAKRSRVMPTPRTNSAISHVQQVAATWVPPREDSIDQSISSVVHTIATVSPSATAEVTPKDKLSHLPRSCFQPKNEITPILRQSSPRLAINGSKYSGFITDQPLRSYEDKWTLMGRLIEETARELEAKNTELAFRLQKDINDVLFKYQLESLKYGRL